MNNRVTVLGAGAFGTAISTILAENGYKVYLWCYEPELVGFINQENENKLYLSGVKLSKNIIATSSFKEALGDSDFVFQAIPVKFLRKVLVNAKEFVKPAQKIISLSKGLEQDTLKLPSQIIKELFSNSVAIMSGPNFAKEISEKKYTVSLLYAEDKKYSKNIITMLENNYFKLSLSEDPIGMQVGSALKNMISILIGIAEGQKLPQNFIAWLVTKSLEELTFLSSYFGGKKETIYGLSGLGDLLLSLTGSLSRNFALGKDIGKLKLENKFNNKQYFEGKKLPEGVNTIKSIFSLINKNNLDLPILKNTYNAIFDSFDIYNLFKDINV